VVVLIREHHLRQAELWVRIATNRPTAYWDRKVEALGRWAADIVPGTE